MRLEPHCYKMFIYRITMITLVVMSNTKHTNSLQYIIESNIVNSTC